MSFLQERCNKHLIDRVSVCMRVCVYMHICAMCVVVVVAVVEVAVKVTSAGGREGEQGPSSSNNMRRRE